MKYAVLGSAALLTLAAALLVGPANLPLADLPGSAIVWQLRLPRALLAFLVGGALGVASTSLQALVRNPLAEGGILGLTTSADLGGGGKGLAEAAAVIDRAEQQLGALLGSRPEARSEPDHVVVFSGHMIDNPADRGEDAAMRVDDRGRHPGGTGAHGHAVGRPRPCTLRVKSPAKQPKNHQLPWTMLKLRFS